MGGLSPSIIARQKMEDSLRLELEEARRRYETASARYGRLLEETPDGSILSQDETLEQARLAKSEALAEYARVLKIFTQVTVNGQIPNEHLSERKEKVTAGALISIVDDDESVRDSAKALLRSAGYQVAIFESSEEFLESGRLPETGCLILDVRMPGMNGLELQKQLKIAQSPVPVIFVTAQDDGTNRLLAINGGASDFLQKPVAASVFLGAIETALKNR